MNEFLCLGSVILSSGRVQPGIDKRIAQASPAFGALHQPVFNSRDLRVETKRKMYPACILSILLRGAECWTLLRKDLKRLDSFHHKCIRSTLGIPNQQQWDNHITSHSIRQQWGDMETVSNNSPNTVWNGLDIFLKCLTNVRPRYFCSAGYLNLAHKEAH